MVNDDQVLKSIVNDLADLDFKHSGKASTVTEIHSKVTESMHKIDSNADHVTKLNTLKSLHDQFTKEFIEEYPTDEELRQKQENLAQAQQSYRQCLVDKSLVDDLAKDVQETKQKRVTVTKLYQTKINDLQDAISHANVSHSIGQAGGSLVRGGARGISTAESALSHGVSSSVNDGLNAAISGVTAGGRTVSPVANLGGSVAKTAGTVAHPSSLPLGELANFNPASDSIAGSATSNPFTSSKKTKPTNPYHSIGSGVHLSGDDTSISPHLFNGDKGNPVGSSVDGVAKQNVSGSVGNKGFKLFNTSQQTTGVPTGGGGSGGGMMPMSGMGMMGARSGGSGKGKVLQNDKPELNEDPAYYGGNVRSSDAVHQGVNHVKRT